MENKQKYIRNPNKIVIPKSYKILERLYINGDVKFYIKITEYATKYSLIYKEYYHDTEFDDIDIAKDAIKLLRYKEEPFIVENDKIYDVSFDEKQNMKIDDNCSIDDYKNILNI